MKKIMVSMLAILMSTSIVGCGMNNKEDREKVDDQNITTNVKDELYANNDGADQIAKEDDLKGKEFKLSYKNAVEKYKERHPNTEIKEIELDKKHTSHLYEIEGFDKEKEYEFNINAQTGEIVKDDEKMMDEAEKKEDMSKRKIDLNSVIEPSKAIDIASKKQNGIVEEWSLKNKNDRHYYTVKIIDNKKEYKVKVDAKTSEVIETKED